MVISVDFDENNKYFPLFIVLPQKLKIDLFPILFLLISQKIN